MSQKKLQVYDYSEELKMFIMVEERYYKSEEGAREYFDSWPSDGGDYDRWYGEGEWEVQGDWGTDTNYFCVRGEVIKYITLVEVNFIEE